MSERTSFKRPHKCKYKNSNFSTFDFLLGNLICEMGEATDKY